MVWLVGAFQRSAEGLFDRLSTAGSISRRKNVFQSLREGSALWRLATGKDYEDLLSASDMADLLKFFQQRHLLAQCEGIVDLDYVNSPATGAIQSGSASSFEKKWWGSRLILCCY
jgi:hypothetical protein